MNSIEKSTQLLVEENIDLNFDQILLIIIIYYKQMQFDPYFMQLILFTD